MVHHPPPSDSPRPIRKRLVCYFSGFDPQGPSHYHQLYATEGARQAEVSGYTLSVGRRRKQGDHIAYWDVEVNADGQSVDTRYEFLRWDDIVRAHWPRGHWGLLRCTVFASWSMWRNGVMWHTLRTSWPMFVAIALPGALVLGLGLLLAALLGLALWLSGLGSTERAIAVLCVLFGLPLLAKLALVAERRSHMDWLMRSMACLVRQGRGQTPELETRLDGFATHVAEQIRSGQYDEVLVAGHSSGAMLAMITLARALRCVPPAPSVSTTLEASIGLLTMGHCSPLLTQQAEAQAFREEVSGLLNDDRICWVDYGAPPDGCCYPLVDPSDGCGHTSSTAQRPKLLNPRFAELFDKTGYEKIRTDKFRCHFQYLMAGTQAGRYDYFAITGGPWSLAERHAAMQGVVGFRQFQCFGGPAA